MRENMYIVQPNTTQQAAINYEALYHETQKRLDKANDQLDKAQSRLDKANAQLEKAQSRLDKANDRIDTLQAQQGNQTYKGDTTLLVDFAEEWFTLKKTQIKESTWAKNRIYYKNHIAPYFKENTLSSLDIPILQKFFNIKCSEGLAIGTIKIIKSVLSMILTTAVRWGLIPNTQIQYIELKKEPPSFKRALSREEITRLLNATENERFWIVPYLLLETGLRPSEALGLKWKRVDLENRTLLIVETVTQDVHSKALVGGVKTNSSLRYVGISPSLVEKLKQYRKEQIEAFGYKEYVLGNRRKNTPSGYTIPKTLQDLVKKWGKKANIPDLHGYIFRHTFPTIALEEGVAMQTVVKQMGHTTTRLVETTYGHNLTINEQKECAEIVTKAI